MTADMNLKVDLYNLICEEDFAVEGAHLFSYNRCNTLILEASITCIFFQLYNLIFLN